MMQLNEIVELKISPQFGCSYHSVYYLVKYTIEDQVNRLIVTYTIN